MSPTGPALAVATGVNVSTNACTGTLIAPSWVLTAAHCFNDIPIVPWVSTSKFGAGHASAVRFHPKTWSSGETTWQSALGTIDHAYDVALVRLEVSAGTPPAKLYHPANPPTLTGHHLELIYRPRKRLDDFLFPGETLSDPAPLLTLDPDTLEATVWLVGGGFVVTEALTSELRAALADSSTRWVGASEPVSVTNDPNAPRALEIGANGAGGVVAELTRSATGFGREAIEEPSAMAARSGFATAYSRTMGASGTLFVAGGVDLVLGAPLADLWSWTPAGGWSSMPLVGQVPVQVRAATYAHRDWRLWMVDQTSLGLILIRVNPMTGNVVSAGGHDVLADLGEVWLSTLDDGRVLLSGNLPNARHRLAVLEATPFADDAPVVAAAAVDRDGVLSTAPAVRNAFITYGLEETIQRRTVIEPGLVAVAELAP